MAKKSLKSVIDRIAVFQEPDDCLAVLVAVSLRLATLNTLSGAIETDVLASRRRVLEGQLQTLEHKRTALLSDPALSGVDVSTIQSADEEEINALLRRKRDIRDELEKKAKQHWLTNGEKREGQWHCRYCGRRLTKSETKQLVQNDFSVVVLQNGVDFMAQACSEECRIAAADNYEKEKECLKQQLTDLRAMKQMVTSINREALRLLKQESQQEKSSAVS